MAGQQTDGDPSGSTTNRVIWRLANGALCVAFLAGALTHGWRLFSDHPALWLAVLFLIWGVSVVIGLMLDDSYRWTEDGNASGPAKIRITAISLLIAAAVSSLGWWLTVR